MFKVPTPGGGPVVSARPDDAACAPQRTRVLRCSQKVYVKDEKVVQIEGNPDSPVSRGRLCPKGAAGLQLTIGSARMHQVLYRPPRGTDWQPISLEQAMHMVADRVIETRAEYWQEEVDGDRTARTMSIAILGGTTLDNEKNTHWEDGGQTDLDNLVLVCPYHHRLHHRGVIDIQGPAPAITVRDSQGRRLQLGSLARPRTQPPPTCRPARGPPANPPNGVVRNLPTPTTI